MTKYGHLFEKSAIHEWVDKYQRCPLTNKPLSHEDIFPAYSVKSAIDEYRVKASKQEIKKAKAL